MRKKIAIIGLVLALVAGIALMKVAADSTVYAVDSYEDLISGENGATLSAGVITVPADSVITVNGTIVIPDSVTIGGKGLFTRGAALTAAPMFEVTSTGSLTLGDISINGGAVWKNSKVIAANNTGISASSPMISVAPGGSFTAGAGSKLLNNHNTSSDSVTNARGGAIYNNGGTVTFAGGTVSFCLSGGSGGAIFSEGTDAKLELNAGVIFSNTAVANGGAVYCGGGEASCAGVTLLYNTAGANGGAICTAACPLTMTAGAITGNKAGTAGGGIYPGSLFNIGGSVNIYDNTKAFDGSDTTSNVYLGEGRLINLASLLEETAKVGIDPSVYARNRMLVHGSPCAASNSDLAHFALDDPSVYQLTVSAGNIVISSEPVANVYVGTESMSSCISWEQVISAAAGAGSQSVKVELLRDITVSQPTVVAGTWEITSKDAQKPCRLYSNTAENIFTVSGASSSLTVANCTVENNSPADTSTVIAAPEGTVRISAASVNSANGSAIVAGGELAIQLSSSVTSASLTQPTVVCTGKLTTYASTIASSGGMTALVAAGTQTTTSSNIATTSDVNAAVVITDDAGVDFPPFTINGGLISNSGKGAAIENKSGVIVIASKTASFVGRVRTVMPIADSLASNTHFTAPMEVELCALDGDSALVTAQYVNGKTVVSGSDGIADYSLYDPSGMFSLVVADENKSLIMIDRREVVFNYNTSDGTARTYYIGCNSSKIYDGKFSTATIAPVITSGTGTFEGWSTERGAGVLVLDANGALIPGVDGYTDGEGNWIYSGSLTPTLYAKWLERTYYLRVLEGEGTGYYYAGQSVPITANQTSNTGILTYYFYYWYSYSDGTFENSYMRSTNFTMPAHDVTVAGKYDTLEVVQKYWNEHGGTGGGTGGEIATTTPATATTQQAAGDSGMTTADPAKRADALTFIGADYTTFHEKIEPSAGDYSYSHREIPKGGFLNQSGQEDLPEEDLKVFIGATGPDGFVPEGYKSEYYVTDADIPQLGGTIAVLLIAFGFMLLSGMGINYAVHLYRIRRVRWKARYRNYM